MPSRMRWPRPIRPTQRTFTPGAGGSAGPTWASVLAAVGAAHAWRLADGDYSDSVGSLDLTATGTVGSGAGPGGVSTAADLDGANGNYLSASDAGLAAGAAARSFALWHRADATPGVQCLLSYGFGGSGNGLIAYYNEGKVVASNFTSEIASTAAHLTTDWQHTAWVYDGSGWTFYLNGSAVAGGGAHALDTTPNGVLRVGPAVGGVNLGFAGLVCDPVYKPGVLTAPQVAALHNGGVRLP